MQQPHAWPVNPSGFNSVPPVSTAVYGTTSSWAHTVPSLMPWVPCGPVPPCFGDPCTSSTPTSWEMAHGLTSSPHGNLHLKRKGDLADASPPKVCITEERMAARFREMHISGSPAPPVLQPPPSTIKDLVLSSSEEDALSSAKSLVLAPEIKKLVEPEKIFASAFFNKVERPSMALVVWQPQQQVFGATQKEDSPLSSSSSEESADEEANKPPPPDEVEMSD